MHVSGWGPPYSKAGTSEIKQGRTLSLPLDQYALRWDFQGQMAVRKQGLGWERKDWVPATTGEDRGHAQGVMKLGAGAKDQGKEGQASPEQNQTLHHDPSRPTIPVPRGVCP